MKVIKRDGSLEELDISKIRKQTEEACTELKGVTSEELELELSKIMKDGIKSEDIQNALIQIAMNKTAIDKPNWSFVAARLALFDLYHKIKHKYNKAVSGNVYEIVDLRDCLKYTKELDKTKYSDKEFGEMGFDLDKLQNEILKHYKNDYNFTIYGLNLLVGRYLIKDENNEAIELPQHMFMHIAMMLAVPEKKEERTEWAIKFYNVLTNLEAMMATPTLSNLRKKFSNCFSCYVGVTDDNLESIMDGFKEQAIISKWGGGLGWDYSLVRSLGGPIQNIKGLAKGKVPWLKIDNDLMIGVDQLGARPGSLNAYVSSWDKDVLDFLDVKKSGGEERRTCEDLFITLVADDVFMKQNEIDGEWWLFDPYDVPKLNNTWGKEFADAYWAYVEKAKNEPDSFANPPIQTTAREIMRTVVKYMNDVGMPFMFFKDNVNKAHKHPEEGLIRTSNLCVVPETKILTKKGYKAISKLSGTKQEIWNGEEWSEVDIVKTADNQKILNIKTSIGDIECTEYHKFYIAGSKKGTMIEKRAWELLPGEKIIKFDLPVIKKGKKKLKLAYENGFFAGNGYSAYENRDAIVLKKSKSYLQGEFRKVHRMDGDDNKRVLWFRPGTFKEKDFVPLFGYKLETRIEWLSGFIDACGVPYMRNNNQTIFLNSVNREQLKQVSLLLQTLGVSVRISTLKGYQNKRHNGYHRLLISTNGIQKLVKLGLDLKTIKIFKPKNLKGIIQHVTVLEVVNENRYSDTYCFTEPKRHMGMFNGILTGQCMEIAQPTTSEKTAICNLASLNLSKVNTEEKIEEVVPLVVRMLDNVNDVTDYISPKHEKQQKRTRAIGLGIMGEAELVATNSITFGSNKHKEVIDVLYNNIYTTAEKASKELADEKGSWKRGESRNAYIGAIAPTSSISHICATTASHEPVFKKIWYEEGIFGNVPVVAPKLDVNTFPFYVSAYDVDQKDMLELTAIRQKYVDQSVSHNLYYVPEEITAKTIFENILYAWKKGVKTLYYTRTKSRELEKESDGIHCFGCE